MIISHNRRFHTTQHILVRGYEFAETHNLNLVEASNSKIFVLVLIVICWKEIVKNKDYKSNYYLTIADCQCEFWRLCNVPKPTVSQFAVPYIKLLGTHGRLPAGQSPSLNKKNHFRKPWPFRSNALALSWAYFSLTARSLLHWSSIGKT